MKHDGKSNPKDQRLTDDLGPILRSDDDMITNL